jgi:8-oxo-dGTP diphosphatase
MKVMEISDTKSNGLFFSAAFSIDITLLTYSENRIKVLLVKKEEEPYCGKLGLPGKLIRPIEDTMSALDSYMKTLIGTNRFHKKQLKAFADVGRHPLGRVITIAYYGLIPEKLVRENTKDELIWTDVSQLPSLSYDHNRIVESSMKRFRKDLLRYPNVFEMLDKNFILSEVIDIYEQAFVKDLDSPNFRRQLKDNELIRPVGETRYSPTQMGRPPQVYTFDKKKYKGRLTEPIGLRF